ncbi:MAG: hypothetical protein ACOYJL_03160 [Tractidigestivibacter sp.]|jgi:isopentenyl-diphosphate delta-isomerase|uniref:prenylated flavin chaperone LpdD n=1 Tax=Tractidigestivibacter sp. TaxID=2847320 RepID=UPI003D8D237D
MIIKTLTCGEGRYALQAVVVVTGNGVTVTICTAEHDHLGATAQAVPRPEHDRTATTSLLAVPCHRDDVPAHDLAASLATKLRVPVAVSAGMHIDNASREDIQMLLDNTQAMGEKIVEVVRGSQQAR